MAPRVPRCPGRPDLSQDGRGRRRQRLARRLGAAAHAGPRRTPRHRVEGGSGSGGLRAGRARAPRRARGRLPPGAARRHRSRPRCHHAPGGGGHRHGRRRRRRRRSQGGRLGGTATAARRRSIGGPVRASVHAVAARRDRSGSVRSRRRGPVRPHGGHAHLARGMAARRPVRRATGRAPRGSRLLLARAARRIPCPHDPARSRAASRRLGARRAARGASSERSLLRGSSGDRRHAQELRTVVAPVASASRSGAGNGPSGVLGLVATVRRGPRSGCGLGVEPRASARDALAPRAGAIGAQGPRPAAPSVHGIGRAPSAAMVRDGRTDPGRTA